MTKHRRAFIYISFALILFLVYSYRLPQSFVVDSDFARDLDEMARIIRGHITLIGPPLSFGGIFTPPFYYYLFSPFFMFGMHVSGVLYANTMLYAAAGGYLLYQSRKLGWSRAILISACLCLNPLTILLARHPGNGFSYVAFFMVYLTYLLSTNMKKWWQIGLAGILAAAMISFHPVALLPLLPLSYLIYRKASARRFMAWYVGPIVLIFLPVLLFEAKHGFVTAKALLMHKSFSSFFSNNATVYDISGKKNPFTNFVFLSGQLQATLTLHPLVLMLSGLYVWPLRRKIDTTDWFVYCSAVCSFICLAALLRFRYQEHYLYIFGIFLLYAGIYLIARYGRYAILILITVFMVELTYFPVRLYADSTRPYDQFDDAVRLIINKGIVKKAEMFNIFSITDKYVYVPVGHEYRFFMRKYGYEPKSEYEYASSDILLIFSEDDTVDVRGLHNWEIEQFGIKYLSSIQRYKAGKVTIYVIRKTPLL